MSFSKAKLTRFNEITSCAPAPGKYNPKLEERITDTPIPTTGRFPEHKRPPGSVHSESGSSKSVISTPCFRTPILPRRRQLIGSLSARKATPESRRNLQNEELREKIVECINKTQSILELESQIDELKEKIRSLSKEIERLELEVSTAQETHESAIQMLQEEKNIALEELKVKHEKELNHLERELENCDNLEEYKQQIEVLTAEKSMIQLEIDEMQLSWKENLEKTLEAHRIELKEHEAQSEAILKECQALAEFKIIECELEKKDVTMRLSDTERDLRKLLQENSKYLAALASNKTIINDLQRKLSAVIIELNDTRENFEREKKSMRIELENSHIQKRRYAITLDETRLTVDVLRKRLVESDRDVEQLKKEMEKLEASKLHVDNLNSELDERTTVLEHYNTVIEETYNNLTQSLRQEIKEKELQLTNAVNDFKQDTLQKIAESDKCIFQLQNELAAANTHLLVEQAKLSDLSLASARQIAELNEELKCKNDVILSTEEKNNLLQKNNDQLHHQFSEVLTQLKLNRAKHMEAQSLISNARVEIEKQETENTELKFKLKRLEAQLTRTGNDDTRSMKQKPMQNYAVGNKKIQKNDSIDSSENKYIELLEKYQALETKTRQQIEGNTESIPPLDIKISTEIAEAEINRKISDSIVLDLQTKNVELNREKQDLETKLRQQSNLIEKLKSELSSVTKSPRKPKIFTTDKENQSPIKQGILTRAASPNVTPLKARNALK